MSFYLKNMTWGHDVWAPGGWVMGGLFCGDIGIHTVPKGEVSSPWGGATTSTTIPSTDAKPRALAEDI